MSYDEAKVYALDGVTYSNDDIFLFSDVDLSILDKNYEED